MLAVRSKVDGDSFLIGTGVMTTVKEVVEMIIDISGTSLRPAYVDQGERFGKMRTRLNVAKAQASLGFRAEVSLREGLKRYFDSIRLGRRPTGNG